MPPEELRIQRLRLRLPGVRPERARAIARRVAERVGERLGVDGYARDLARAELRVRVSESASDTQLVDTIARRVLEALR